MTKEVWEKAIVEVQARVKPRALRVGHRAVGDTVPCIAHPLSSLLLMPFTALFTIYQSHTIVHSRYCHAFDIVIVAMISVHALILISSL